MAAVHAVKLGLCAVLCVTASACGGGGGGAGSGSGGAGSGGGGTPGNVASVILDQGPNNASVNTLFASVTVCVPGSTSSCQTIDHIQVDTGSYGLRILAPVLTSALNAALPVEMLSNGKSVAECTQFVDGFAWGPIVTADVQIAGESAKSVPVQLIGDSRYSSVPSDCSSTGPSEDTVALFGANGILGIGPFEIDQPGCANAPIAACYYACATATSCASSAVPTAMLVPNPVTRFATDNNGAILELPSVPSPALTVTGSLIFGIDTQTNNASGTQTVLTVDQNAELLMTFNGQNLANSFIDSGSNGIYFNDTGIAKCTAMNLGDFYCPVNTLTLPLSMQGMNGVMANNLTFDVGNAQAMLTANPTFNVFPQLAGTNPNQGSFDYGLAFFYGKRVAIAVEDKVTTAGTGPYIAF
ncbi:MAG TPA: DUF3443 family protein [Steroidobacteraceae bacterium]|jgi:hypothetical protein|nr:DUF3443 family protein [Steroidobacteraceae bacterium]